LLILPIQFDANEWFVLIVLIFLLSAFIFLPKILPHSITIALLLFFAAIGKWTDYVLGIKYQLYIGIDTYQQELFDWLCLGVAYPLFGYFYVYFMMKWKLKGVIVAPYILVWAALIWFLEWVSTLFKVFTYNEWRLTYSFFVYLTLLITAFFYVKVIFRFYSEEKDQDRQILDPFGKL